MIRHTRHTILLTLGMTLCLAGAGCPKQPPSEPKPKPTAEAPAVQPQPQVQPPAPVATEQPKVQTRPAETKPVESRPAASQPVSTYDPRPPYVVKLHVRDPKDKQPGWLRILKLSEESQAATAEGRFPEQNDIDVTTGNVQQIQVQIGFLPLAPRVRTFLRIDQQGIEITTKGREFVILERSPAGAWRVVPQKK
jgi:hypothetical protein